MPTRKVQPPTKSAWPSDSTDERELHDVANRLHSLAIHLLRTVRKADTESGLSAARLSALSVIVFGGPITLGDLAAAEQVSAPTMTRMVQGLESDGLAKRTVDATDGRVFRITATAKGNRILQAGRERRVQLMEEILRALQSRDVSVVEQAIVLLERAVAKNR